MSCTEFNERVLAACIGGGTVFAGPDCTRAVLLDEAVARRCIHEENGLNWPPFSHYLCRSPRDRTLDGVCAPAPGGGGVAPVAGAAVQAAPVADNWTMGPVGVAGTAVTALAVGALGQSARAKRNKPRSVFELPETNPLFKGDSLRDSLRGASSDDPQETDRTITTMNKKQLRAEVAKNQDQVVELQAQNEDLEKQYQHQKRALQIFAELNAKENLTDQFGASLAHVAVTPPTIDQHGEARFQFPLDTRLARKVKLAFMPQLRRKPQQLSDVSLHLKFTDLEPPPEQSTTHKGSSRRGLASLRRNLTGNALQRTQSVPVDRHAQLEPPGLGGAHGRKAPA